MPKDRKVVKHVKWGGHAGVLVAGESFEALQLVLAESLLQRVTAESPTGLPYQAPLVGLLAASNLSQMHSARMNLSAQALSSGQEGAAPILKGIIQPGSTVGLCGLCILILCSVHNFLPSNGHAHYIADQL